MDKYEYYLKYWGEIENDNCIEKELGIKGTNFWFDKKYERDNMYCKLNAFALIKNKIIVFKCEEGKHVRYKTIAYISLKYNDKTYDIEYDFGFAFKDTFEECKQLAEYMFYEGNYSCDCNKLIFIDIKYNLGLDIDTVECGEEIEIIKFKVENVKAII